jgi:hypothetical protein
MCIHLYTVSLQLIQVCLIKEKRRHTAALPRFGEDGRRGHRPRPRARRRRPVRTRGKQRHTGCSAFVHACVPGVWVRVRLSDLSCVRVPNPRRDRRSSTSFVRGVQINLSVQTMKTEGKFVKVWLHNPSADLDYKIIQSLIPLGCWSNDSNWSFYSLHEKVSLHLIRFLVRVLL